MQTRLKTVLDGHCAAWGQFTPCDHCGEPIFRGECAFTAVPDNRGWFCSQRCADNDEYDKRMGGGRIA